MTIPVRTTCPYCGVGCGVLAELQADGAVTVKGDADHPANLGRLCSKGSALGETVDLGGRLLYPQINGERASWDAALELVAGRFRDTIDRHGPEAVAFYVSGQILTEDYYVANKLMKGYIGAANIDTNSRLCMASSVAGHKRAFGTDTVPCSYEDLELADLLVLVGSNAAWCHPVLWQRMLAARRQRPSMKIVVIDPRRTATAEDADLFLPIRPGSDVMLFNGLLTYLRREDKLDLAFLDRHTEGFGEAFATAKETAPSIPAVAAACDIDATQLSAFYKWFASNPKVITLYSQGVNQSSSGTDKVNAIINCHLATGRIGKAGMGPFSLTGQPNAMGGREVGGLANQLAVHLDIDNPEHRDRVQRFWDAPVIAQRQGLKAVDMFRALADGGIKAIWIMATNPVVSMPDADAVRAALAGAEFVVVSDCIDDTDTNRLADVKLPALAWGEKDGTVTNSERRISRQRAFLPVPGEARADWWMFCEVARRMGFPRGFAFSSAADVFREYAAMTAFENCRDDGRPARDLDIGALASIDDAEYQRLAPLQWPLAADGTGTSRMFEDGRYFTPSGKARFIAVRPRPAANVHDDDYPLILNTARVRDHWHTMTRTGRSARLSVHIAEPLLEIHAEDAIRHRLRDGQLASVSSRWGNGVFRVRVSRAQRIGDVCVPMHWNDVFASHGRIDAVVNPDNDPVSGQPELKHTPVRVTPYEIDWSAWAFTRSPLSLGRDGLHWVRRVARNCQYIQLGGRGAEADAVAMVRQALADHGDSECIEYIDAAAGRYRVAIVKADVLQAVMYLSRGDEPPAGLAWVEALFAAGHTLSRDDRRSLLSGRAARARPETGPVICACHGVGVNAILEAAAAGCCTVDAIGEKLGAGTNCGSCRSEIDALLRRGDGGAARSGK